LDCAGPKITALGFQ
jgi:hypothetical protein